MIQRLSLVLLSSAVLCSCSSKPRKAVVPKEPLVLHITKAPHKDSLKKAPAKDTSDNDPSLIKIYLTFDDGPYKTTPEVVSILNKEKVKASFFIVGKQVFYKDDYQHWFDSVSHDSLFRTYNHTYSHGINHGKVKAYYKYPANVWADIEKNKRMLHLPTSITRLPGKNAWYADNVKVEDGKYLKPLFNWLDSTHSDQRIFGWDYEWSFNEKQDVEKLVPAILRTARNAKVRNNIVILMHDFQFDSPAEEKKLTEFIKKLKENTKVRFKWVEEHPFAAS